MKNLIKYLLSFFSAVAFLTVTSGFTIYTHHCSDTSIREQSILESQVECKHKFEKFILHDNHDEQSCCATNCQLKTESKDCCTNKKQFYKISVFYTLPSIVEEEKYFTDHAIITALTLFNIEIEKYDEESVSYYSLPPPLSGKQIVILYHQLKTTSDPDLIVV